MSKQVKVQYENQIRRFTLQAANNYERSLFDVRTFLKLEKVALFYRDEDDEFITINSQQDWDEFLSNSPNLPKLIVQEVISKEIRKESAEKQENQSNFEIDALLEEFQQSVIPALSSSFIKTLKVLKHAGNEIYSTIAQEISSEMEKNNENALEKKNVLSEIEKKMNTTYDEKTKENEVITLSTTEMIFSAAGDVRGGGTGREFVENLGNSSTAPWDKWFHPGHVTSSWIQAVFNSPQVLARYGLQSANDVPGRDPMAWELIGTTENGEDIVLHQGEYDFKNRWEWVWFDIPSAVSVQKVVLKITKIRDGINCGVQLGHLHFHVKAPLKTRFPKLEDLSFQDLIKLSKECSLEMSARITKAEFKRPLILNWGNVSWNTQFPIKRGWYDLRKQGVPNDYVCYVGDGQPNNPFRLQCVWSGTNEIEDFFDPQHLEGLEPQF